MSPNRELLVGELLRSCRTASGLTQSELAERAGTSQPAIARYEHGDTSPTIRTLDRILRACDRDLRISAEPRPREPLSGRIGRQVVAHRDAILKLAELAGARNLRVFGSVARGDESPDSDLDLLAEFPVDELGLMSLAGLGSEIEELLDVAVDVTTDELLGEHVAAEVAREAVNL